MKVINWGWEPRCQLLLQNYWISGCAASPLVKVRPTRLKDKTPHTSS